MYDIIGVGASTYDTLMVLSKFPIEDTKLLANRTMGQGGGPCTTALVAATKLGMKTAYIGNMGDDAAGNFMIKDLNDHGVDTSYISVKQGYLSYMSFVLLSESKGTRTCVWSKGNVPKLDLTKENVEAIKKSKVLHIDGNHIDAAIEAVIVAKHAKVKISMDAGGVYHGVERLLPYIDYLIPSEEFAMNFTRASSIEAAAKQLYYTFHPEVLIITQGERGGFLYNGNIKRYPSFPVTVLDSNGAGDVFHGAFLSEYITGKSAFESATFASAVSALKCSRLGGRDSVPDRKEVMRFMEKGGKINEV